MKIRPYSKSELAQAYAPEITSQAALNRLAAWIRLNRPLTEALRQTGYYTKQDRKSTRLNSSHIPLSCMLSSV